MQLFINYITVLNTKEWRRTKLSRVYSFHCCCDRCCNEDEIASGLLAGASDEIPASVVEECVKEGLMKIEVDVAKMKSANG